MTTRTSYLVAGEPVEDLLIAEETTQDLEDYLVRDDLYRMIIVNLPGGDQKLQVTGGDLLTRIHRLKAVRDQLSPDLQRRLDTVETNARQTIYSLRSRFHDRLRREVKARLDSLKWFLDDCTAEPTRCRAEFPFEMRNRQRIEEILKEVGDTLPPEVQNLLQGIDHRIREVTHATGFIWDKRLQPVFPPQPYWYLYVSP
jgi:hypothetical protein